MLDRATNLPFEWTDDAVAVLTRLWGEGLTASRIAAQMGSGLTRNAIVGKARRLKLSARAAVPPPNAHGNKGQPKAIAIVARAKAAQALPPIPIAQDDETEVGVDVTALVGILDNTGCKFIFGDPLTPEHGYCGAKRKPGSSWCPVHHAQVYIRGAR